MRKIFVAEVVAMLCLLMGSLGTAQADWPTNTFDEFGNGIWADGTLTNGWMRADPGPGGLALALTYDLPFAATAGDVLITEPEEWGGGISDVIRFNGDGTLVFYSEAGESNLGDTGLPTQYYGNTVTIGEVGLADTNNWAVYLPTEGQPGYNAPFAVYKFISDVPEPATVAMVGLSLVGLLAVIRRRK